MVKKPEDVSMMRVRALFEKSGLSLHELGVKMGCPEETARQSVWQFLRTADPHISMLRRFANAIGVTVEELIAEKRKGK